MAGGRRHSRDGHGLTLGSAAGAVKPSRRARRRVRINRHRARAAGATVASTWTRSRPNCCRRPAATTASRSTAPTRSPPCATQFVLPDGVDLPRRQFARRAAAPRPRRARAVSRAREWGEGLIRSWNSAGWIELPQRVGDKIAPLIGARRGRGRRRRLDLAQPLQGAAAPRCAAAADAPRRRVIVSERGNFPTDLYIAEGLAALARARAAAGRWRAEHRRRARRRRRRR